LPKSIKYLTLGEDFDKPLFNMLPNNILLLSIHRKYLSLDNKLPDNYNVLKINDNPMYDMKIEYLINGVDEKFEIKQFEYLIPYPEDNYNDIDKNIFKQYINGPIKIKNFEKELIDKYMSPKRIMRLLEEYNIEIDELENYL
jgi:hypothetical protein